MRQREVFGLSGCFNSQHKRALEVVLQEGLVLLQASSPRSKLSRGWVQSFQRQCEREREKEVSGDL